VTEPYEVGRFVHLPDRYIVCFHVSLSPYALNMPGILAELLAVFADRDVPIVHFKLSRPRPGRPVNTSIFTDLTGKEELENELVKKLRGIGLVRDVVTIRPLFDGVTIDNTFSLLTILGERVIICRKPVYEAFLKNMREKVGVSYMAILYHMGREIGRSLHRELSQITGGDTARTTALCRELFRHMGYGTAKAELDLKRCSAVVRVWDCFECELFKGSGKPASHFVRGIIAGFLSGVFGEEMYAKEVKCIAMGDQYCKFIVKKSSRLSL